MTLFPFVLHNVQLWFSRWHSFSQWKFDCSLGPDLIQKTKFCNMNIQAILKTKTNVNLRKRIFQIYILYELIFLKILILISFYRCSPSPDMCNKITHPPNWIFLRICLQHICYFALTSQSWSKLWAGVCWHFLCPDTTKRSFLLDSLHQILYI